MLIALGPVVMARIHVRVLALAVQQAFTGRYLSIAFVVPVFLLTLAATFWVGWSRSAVLRWLLGGVLGLGTAATAAMFWVGEMWPPRFDTVAMLIESRAAAGQIVTVAPVEIAAAILVGLATMIGIGIAPTWRNWRWAAPAGIALFATLVGFGMMSWRTEPGPAAPGWSSVATAALVYLERAMPPQLPPPPPMPAWRGPKPTGDLVLIIDESIGAHYLDINRALGVRSGLRSRIGVTVANFGIAASATNFSVGSNFVLRAGGTRDDYTSRRLSVWTAAHGAGLRTVHIFAQPYAGLQNLMTPAERAQIDDYIVYPGLSESALDHAAGRELRRRLDNGVAEFIIVNKMGAHSPAWRDYPTRAAYYRPTLQSLGAADRALFRIRAGDNPRRYRNEYRNAVAWSVGGFFDLLLTNRVPDDATLIYTSDHGEAMGERGVFMHGNASAALEEGAVPMVVLTGPADRGGWQKAARATHGVSHYRVVATLLALMGYDATQTQRYFGPDLRDPAPDPMTFNSSFYARFGARPRWNRVIPTAIVDPPAGDPEQRPARTLSPTNRPATSR